MTPILLLHSLQTRPHVRLLPPPFRHTHASVQLTASAVFSSTAYVASKLVFLALPAETFAASLTAMPPPAPFLPWVEVGRGRNRFSSKHSTTSDPDAFLNVCISKLGHHNAAFPGQNDVYTLACRIYTCLAPLKMATYSGTLSTGQSC